MRDANDAVPKKRKGDIRMVGKVLTVLVVTLVLALTIMALGAQFVRPQRSGGPGLLQRPQAPLVYPQYWPGR